MFGWLFGKKQDSNLKSNEDHARDLEQIRDAYERAAEAAEREKRVRQENDR